MNFEAVDKIAAAILYEGYILYPYRKTAIKNRQRWNFGTLYPGVYAQAQRPEEPCRLATECLLEAGADATIDVKISFLQLLRAAPQPSQAAGLSQSPASGPDLPASGPDLSDPSLAWDEAVERTVLYPALSLAALAQTPLHRDGSLSFAGVTSETGIQAVVDFRAQNIGPDLWKLRLQLENTSPLPSGANARRDEALPLSFVSAHVLLGVTGGGFVSLLDPPEKFAAAAASCHQSGVFPVLAGEQPGRDILFCSPIILYDYPRIAPESEGDFFDGTEMDEMLSLRVLTLTDAEKQEMREGDPRARRILERTESLTEEAMMKAHGAVRSLRNIHDDRPIPGNGPDASFGMEPWDPFAESKAPPQSVRIFGVDVRVGDKVRLWPQKTADIMDLALAGKVAMIEAIEQDFEDVVQFAVVLDDDPGREFGMMRQPGHRFFFSPDEVEPVGAGEVA